ncbi:MAG: Uncharacterized MFS-type transporter [uncultured Paraburkholderia sp.]|nr:MAG: Uncharacterized MFS-type transporter [uncultured Paraburkholderia sp.]
MLAVAMGWHIYALTHSAFALGLVGLAQFLPMFLLTLVVGHFADRYDRRRIAAICQSLESVAALLFALGTFGGWISAPAIYVLAACVGAARAFESPAVASLLPGVVPRDQLPKATAWATSANQTAQIACSTLGGLLYDVGPGAAYLACMLSFAAAFAVWAIPLQAKPASRAPVTLESVFSGIKFIRSEPVILGALSLDLFAVLFGGVIAFDAATVVFGLSHQFTVSLIGLFVLGASDTISVVVRLSLVQLRTPDEMLGRVSAVNSLFIGTSNQLGEFESGLTAGWWGAQPAVLVGGFATIAVALLWMKFFPELKRTRTLERVDELVPSQ